MPECKHILAHLEDHKILTNLQRGPIKIQLYQLLSNNSSLEWFHGDHSYNTLYFTFHCDTNIKIFIPFFL